MLEIRKANDRGMFDHGWLDTRHSFSFADYHDPDQVGFSDLLVINDDRVKPPRGFGTHPHQNMEIFSYVLEGQLEHRDSMGTGSVNGVGDIQMMSAGTGIHHSEFNHSDKDMLRFLQIWIVPDRKNVTPRYHQRRFPSEEKRGKLRLVISPDEKDGSLPVYQDIRVYAGLFDGGESAELELAPDRYAYVQVAKGEISVNGRKLEEGDGARVRKETKLTFDNGKNAEILVFDMRPREIPDLRRM
jgi:redox-sensitive bicupin YhaK (pirin superfamily)